MANFTTNPSTQTITQNVEFSVAQGANYSAGSPKTTTGYVGVCIDFTALVAGDIVEVRAYRGVNGGTAAAVDVITIKVPQMLELPLKLVGSGWDVSVKLTTATSRSIKYEVVNDTNDVNVASISANAITAGSIATDAIDNDAIASNAVTEIQNGLATTTALATAQTDLTTLTGRLTSGRALGLDNLNATITSRADAATALSTAVWTGTRAAFLDNLNVGGNVASSAEVVAVQNNTRVVRVVPTIIERPDSGTTTYRIEVLLYDNVGNMEVPDSIPTVDLVNQAGTSRTARLDSTTMTLVSTGRYRSIYTADAADALEQLVWAFSVVEGAATRVYGNNSVIVDTTAVDFTSSDRTLLTTLATDYTTARAAKLDQLDDSITSRAAATDLADVASDLVDVGIDVDALQAAVDDLGDRLPAALDGGGNIKAGVQSIAGAVVTALVDSIFGFEVEAAPANATTFVQRLRIWWSILSAHADGLAIGAAGTEHFRNAANTKDRITYDLATDGTRTPGTFDGD